MLRGLRQKTSQARSNYQPDRAAALTPFHDTSPKPISAFARIDANDGKDINEVSGGECGGWKPPTARSITTCPCGGTS